MADAFGIGEFSIAQAGRLADVGYVALAGDLYGGGFRASNHEEIAAKFGAVTADATAMRANVAANMDALAAVDGVDRDRLGAIGFCLGGTAVLELARSGYDCRSVVSFHGLLTTTLPATSDSLRASVLVCTGADDPYAPLADVLAFQAEMSAANADCQVIVYTGTEHSFTNPDSARDWPGIAFHPQNARRSWQAMLAFFDERNGALRSV
jgi:dienelactone hydrolase